MAGVGHESLVEEPGVDEVAEMDGVGHESLVEEPGVDKAAEMPGVGHESLVEEPGIDKAFGGFWATKCDPAESSKILITSMQSMNESSYRDCKKNQCLIDVMPSQAKIKDLIDVLPSQAFECRFKFCLIFKAFKILVLVFWLKEHELTSLQDC